MVLKVTKMFKMKGKFFNGMRRIFFLGFFQPTKLYCFQVDKIERRRRFVCHFGLCIRQCPCYVVFLKYLYNDAYTQYSGDGGLEFTHIQSRRSTWFTVSFPDKQGKKCLEVTMKNKHYGMLH